MLRPQVAILATLCCALACGPRQLAIEGDDEAMATAPASFEHVGSCGSP